MTKELKKSLNAVLFILFIIYTFEILRCFLLTDETGMSFSQSLADFIGIGMDEFPLRALFTVSYYALMLLSLIYKTYTENRCFDQITYYSSILLIFFVALFIATIGGNNAFLMAYILLVIPELAFGVTVMIKTRKPKPKEAENSKEKLFKRAVNASIYICFLIYTFCVIVELLHYIPEYTIFPERNLSGFLMGFFEWKNTVLFIVYLVLMFISLKYKTYIERQYFIKIFIFSAFVILFLCIAAASSTPYALGAILLIIPQLAFGVTVLLKKRKLLTKKENK